MAKTKEHINNVFSILLVTLVLFSTSGFSIYSHHCNHNNVSNYSIIVPAEECGHQNESFETESCCKVEIEAEPSCCQKPDPTPEKDDCCSDTMHLVKLETEILLNHTTPIVKVNKAVLLCAVLVFNNLAFNNAPIGIQTELISESPPPISVNAYLSLIQVFLI